jgi:hypothetical protein
MFSIGGDKLNLDILSQDESLENRLESELGRQRSHIRIAEDLQAALAQFPEIATDLKTN